MTNDYNEKLKRAAMTRRARALKLHESGKTYEQIGERMGGISHQRVSQLVKQAKKDRAQESQEAGA